MAGDAETGVSIMALTPGLDDGPVCLTSRTPIGPEDTYGTISERLQRLSAALLLRRSTSARRSPTSPRTA
jgi:methionyl-tRNA formyltransferase